MLTFLLCALAVTAVVISGFFSSEFSSETRF